MTEDLPPPPRHPSSRSARPPTDVSTPPARNAANEQQSATSTVPRLAVTPAFPQQTTGDEPVSPEDIDRLAAEIASTIPAPPRRTRGAASGKATPAPPRQPLSPEEAALRELEDEEIAQFLARVGRQVQSVQIDLKQPLPLPVRKDFQDGKTGRTDWQSYVIACSTVLAHNLVPSSLIEVPRDEFSFTLARQHVERLYTCFPRSSWDKVLNGAFARIYRWQHPQTPLWAVLYFSLWFWDLVPVLPFALVLWHLLAVRWFPPDQQDLLKAARTRRVRAKEASDLSKSMTVSNKLGVVFDGARSLVKSKLVSDDPFEAEGGALVKGLQGSARLAAAHGSGATNERSPSPSREPAPPASAAPTLPASQHDDTPQREKDVSLYRLGIDARERFGPLAQTYMGDAADLSEMVRNMFLHPEHPSVPHVCARLAIVIVVLHIVPRWIQYKAMWAYAGLEFFVLWKLREDLPQWRRALTPIWWLFLGAPTDAELATHLLHKRAHSGHLSSEGLTREPAEVRARSSSILSGKFIATSGSKASSIRSLDGERISSTHFAILDTIAGDVVTTDSRLAFMPLKGFRTLSRRAAGISSTTTLKPDELVSFLKEDKSVLLNVAFDDVVSVTKTSKFGTKGITLTIRSLQSEKHGAGKQKVKMMNVSRRDELFNKIIASSSQLTTL